MTLALDASKQSSYFAIVVIPVIILLDFHPFIMKTQFISHVFNLQSTGCQFLSCQSDAISTLEDLYFIAPHQVVIVHHKLIVGHAPSNNVVQASTDRSNLAATCSPQNAQFVGWPLWGPTEGSIML
jgi:hypothetical protein